MEMSGLQSESDDGLCDYEKQRFENIKRNQNMLRSLGLPLPTKPKLVPASRRGGKRGRGRKSKRKKKACSDSDSSYECGSESSEEEWQPWKEESRKRPRGKAVGKMTPLDAQSKAQIFNAARTEIRSKLKALKEGRKAVCTHGRSPVEIKKKSKSQRKKCVVEALFHSSDDEDNEKEFVGFSREEVEKSCAEVCQQVHGAGREMWVALFGEDDDENNEEFGGFSPEEILSTEVPKQAKRAGASGRCKIRVNYEEAVISDDDEYVFCEDCQELHHGDCPVHGALTSLPDLGNDTNSMQFTKLPVPAQLTVKTSLIPGAGLGVFANESIAKGVKFGPYVGKRVPTSHVDEDSDTSYMWEIKQEGVKSYYTDGREEECSNWLRFINCARNEEEQNVVAFQYKGHIYYRTFKTVYPGNELLVWYGEEYAKHLGIAVEYSGEQGNHRCKGCGLCFVEKNSFDLHLRHSRKCAEANPRVFKCRKCQRVFSELNQLQAHIRRHQEYDDKENLEPHPVKCDGLEEASFYDNPRPAGHKVKKREHSLRHHKCQYCGKAFSRADSLRVHIRAHTGDKPYKCDHCGRSFTNSGHLRVHIRTHTGDKPYKCDHCGQSFSQAGSLRQHIRTHTGDKPYKCNHCGRSFTNSGHLRVHIRTHTGDKPYKCDHCGQSFSQAGSLRQHIRTHTGDKPYKCNHCGRSFTNSGHLRVHIRTHTGDKPYKCDHCGQSFSQAGHLRVHIRTHTGDKPYKCDHCGQSFTNSSSLKYHTSRRHSSMTE